MSVAQSEARLAICSQQIIIDQPLTCVVSISLKPGASIAESKTVAPCVHVGHQQVWTNAIDLVAEDNLQIANGSLLKVITARISLQLFAPFAGHANDMAGFVQQ